MSSARLLEVLGAATLIILLSPGIAWAYIDPGVGSYLFQLAIAGALAGLYTIRRYSSAVADLFRKTRGTRTSESKRDGVD